MFHNVDRDAIFTLAAVILINFASGILGIWGSANIYFMSYIRQNGQNISSSTNSILMLCSILPAGLLMLFTTKLVEKFGCIPLIKGCGVIFFLAPLCINFALNIYTLTIFVFFLPTAAFSLSSIPVMTCVWSQFPKDRNKATGFSFFFFSIGGIVWNLVLMVIINPGNLPSLTDSRGNAYFDHSVTQNMFLGCDTVYVGSGILFVIGTFLIRKRDESQFQVKYEQKDEKVEDGKKQIARISIISNVQSNLEDDIPEKCKEPQLSPATELNIELIKVESGLSGDIAPEECGSDRRTITSSSEPHKSTLIQSLLDKRFKIIFACTILMSIYPIYLGMNMKLIYMPIINDDHFIALCMVAGTVSATFGAPIWGHLADLKGFRVSFITIAILDIFVKLFGVFAETKRDIMILSIVMGFIDKALLTTAGPGLIDIFGMKMATAMLPYKTMGIFISFILVPITQICFAGILTSHQLLLIYFSMSIFSFILATYYFCAVTDPRVLKKQLPAK